MFKKAEKYKTMVVSGLRNGTKKIRTNKNKCKLNTYVYETIIIQLDKVGICNLK